jgi:hypothetical protein
VGKHWKDFPSGFIDFFQDFDALFSSDCLMVFFCFCSTNCVTCGYLKVDYKLHLSLNEKSIEVKSSTPTVWNVVGAERTSRRDAR